MNVILFEDAFFFLSVTKAVYKYTNSTAVKKKRKEKKEREVEVNRIRFHGSANLHKWACPWVTSIRSLFLINPSHFVLGVNQIGMKLVINRKNEIESLCASLILYRIVRYREQLILPCSYQCLILVFHFDIRTFHILSIPCCPLRSSFNKMCVSNEMWNPLSVFPSVLKPLEVF